MKKCQENPDDRFAYALEFTDGLRDNPRFPTELIDAVQDGLIDLLQRRPDYGQTRGAVIALGLRQVSWRIKDWQRKRMDADGELKAHPSVAQSLDKETIGIDGEGGNLYGAVTNGSAHDPLEVVLGREELREVIDRAREDGLNTLRVVQATIWGLSPQELADAQGAKVNTVHQRYSRFLARHPRESR